MTNEELAVLIQAGERDKLVELWSQVQRFVHDRAYKWAVAVGTAGGVTVEDLTQAGYLALVDAVERFDSAAGGTFLTIMGYSLKTAFTQAAGMRTKREREDPLRAAVSIDVPVSEEEDGDTLGDFIEDPQATQDFESIEAWALHEALEKALQRLAEDQRSVIRCRYYRGLTLEQTGRALGMTKSTAQRTEQKALRVLRHPVNSRALKQYR